MAKEKTLEKLDNLAKTEEEPIYKISSLFPFQLFPDSVIIFRKKIVIIRRYLPFAKREFPIVMEDIKTVTVTRSIFFASLFFEITGYEQNPDPINTLIVSQALEARRILTGLIIMHKNDIPVEDMDCETIIGRAKRIG